MSSLRRIREEGTVHAGMATPVAVLRLARRRLEEVGDAQAVADELGVAAATVRTWNRQHGWGVKLRRGGKVRRLRSRTWRCQGCGLLNDLGRCGPTSVLLERAGCGSASPWAADG